MNTPYLVPNVKFHATPLVNRFQVSRYGILTKHDHRGKGRVWLADISEMWYVMDHLTACRNLTSLSFAVFAVRTDLLQEPVKKHGNPGIYWTNRDIPPHACSLEYLHWCLLDRDDYC